MTCTDVNECATSNGGCYTRTTFSNTLGSRACGPCPAGFTGTGATACMDVNECSTNNGGCSTQPMVSCTNTVGSRSCGACPSGFSGNGLFCADVN